MTTAARLRAVVFRGRLWAALAVPVALVAGAVVAGGGLMMAGFVVAAIPVAGLFALAPLLGTSVGRMRAADDVPLPYALVTVALWVAALPLGFLMTYTQPVPTAYVPLPPGYAAAEAVSAVVGPAVVLLWVAQLVLALVGVRARRRANSDAPVAGPAGPADGVAA
jgi:hypothetical protein